MKDRANSESDRDQRSLTNEDVSSEKLPSGTRIYSGQADADTHRKIETMNNNSPLQAKVAQLQGDAPSGPAPHQKEIYATLGGVDLSGVEGYEAKKALLIARVEETMREKGASDDEISQTLALPLIDHRISILSRGSKTQKLAEGIEVQHMQSEKFNAFLDNIAAQTNSEVHAAPLKNYQRMKAKEEDKYGGDIARIKDVIRASFIFENVEQIGVAQETIKGMSTHTIVEEKNRFDVKQAKLEENLNYRDVIFIVETTQITGKPVKIELQLHLRALHEAKTKIKASFPIDAHHDHVMGIAGSLGLNKGKISGNQYTGHDFYKVIRELTKSDNQLEQEIVEAAKTESKKIYGGAWDDYKNAE